MRERVKETYVKNIGIERKAPICIEIGDLEIGNLNAVGSSFRIVM